MTYAHALQRTDHAAESTRLRVLLITESTFPFHFGGVSSWCRNLITGLPDVDFHILALVAQPDLAPLFELPANVSALTTVPVWGIRDVLETDKRLRFADLRPGARRVEGAALTEGLVPPLRGFVKALFSTEADPIEVAHHVSALYDFFLGHDFDTAMRSAAAWEAFVDSAQADFPRAAAAAGYRDAPIGVSDAIVGLHWLYHWLLPLATELPETDIAHATMAGEAILPAVAAKLHHGAGMVFSEHGVHLRETYLREAADDGSLFLKLLKIGLARQTSEMAYALADRISTCCDYNQRWLLRSRAPSDRVQTIHYGVDGDSLPAADATSNSAPVIVWLGRIDPLKDIDTLLRSAAIVHEQRSDAVFRLYGSAGPELNGYGDRVEALRQELDLGKVVEMRGYVSDPGSAYEDADIVVLTSISEGFPYATLDAMLVAKPIIATAVGGLPEQIADCGVLISPREPEALARAIIELIDDPSARSELGGRARERVRRMFSLEEKNRLHHDAYLAVAKDPYGSLDGAHQPEHANGMVEPDGDFDEDLIDTVRAQVRYPVDQLEIAAVLEAGGVTDDAARTRYRASGVFGLAAAIFSEIRLENDQVTLRPHTIEPQSSRQRSGLRAADGVLMLIPAAILICVGYWLRSIHGWTAGTGRALLWGVSLSALCGNAFQAAIMRRGALLIGCGRWGAARRFLSRWSWAALLGLLLSDVVAVVLAHGPGHLSYAATGAFGLSFAALVGLWILSGGLFLVRRTTEVGLASLAGLVVGVGIYYVAGSSGPGSTGHLEIALAVGYAVTMALIAWRVITWIGRPSRTKVTLRLPRLRYLLREAAPYGSYGGLLIILVLGANLATALRAGSFTDAGAVALGMTLALAPVLLSLPAAEDAAAAVSDRISAVISESPVSRDATELGEVAREFQRHQAARYLAQVAALSLITVPILWAIAGSGALGGLGVHSTGALMLALVISLISYLLLALAQFDLMPVLALGRPSPALRCVLAGLVVGVVVVAVMFAADVVQAGPIGLFAGTITFAVLAARTGRSFFGRVTAYLIDGM